MSLAGLLEGEPSKVLDEVKRNPADLGAGDIGKTYIEKIVQELHRYPLRVGLNRSFRYF